MVIGTSKAVLEQTFASLAILKVNADQQGKDYIEYFIPFVAECVRMSEHDVISLPELQVAILKEFGIQIPQNALKIILSRAGSHGYVTKQNNNYRRKDNAQYDLNIVVERERFLRSHSTLIEELMAYVETRYVTTWSHDQAEKSLFAYLEKNSGPLIAAAVKGSPLAIAFTAVDTEVAQNADYLVNAYVEHLYRSDQDGFETLETIVKGRMLADVLLFEDLNVVKKPFQNVEVYFDTPFMLRVLGCSGESLQAPGLELIQLLRQHGAFLRVFEHTYGEITGILERASRAIRSPKSIGNKRGESLQYFINENLRASDIDLVIAELPDKLDQLQIKVKSYPQHTYDLGVDENKLRSSLQEGVKYKDPEGAMLDHDINSLTAIHRLRAGTVQHRLETCEAIFVTSNHSLARASGRFFNEEYNFSKVPHCILDFVLATLVWLKEPLQLSSDLPRKRIIANCYAALKPDEYLWKMYLDEADSLRQRGKISENTLQLAKSSQRVLMDITRGDTLAFSEGTVLEVINASIQAIRQEEADKLKAEHVAETQSLAAQNARTNDDLLDVSLRHNEAQQKLEEIAAKAKRKNEHVHETAAKIARNLARFIVALLAILLLFEACHQQLGDAGIPRSTVWHNLLRVVIGIASLIGFVHAVFGLSVTELGHKAEKWFTRSIEARIRKWLDA